MQKLALCNTCFENELLQQKSLSINKYLTMHPIFLQLQFLPILYADKILTTHFKEKGLANPFFTKKKEFFTLDQEDFSEHTQIDAWGASQAIARWAEGKNCVYEKPGIQIVKKIHSKLFAHQQYTWDLAKIFENFSELKSWLKSAFFPLVLKAPIAAAGKGLKILYKQEEIFSSAVQLFLNTVFKTQKSVIVQPWVKRVLDFSSQWIITKKKEIFFEGITFFENSPRGVFRKTFIGCDFSSYKKEVEKHLFYAKNLLQTIVTLGYFGNIGIDAMVYEYKNKQMLHPILEVNARKTMSWVFLQCQKRYFPNDSMCFAYLPGRKKGFLPHFLILNGEEKIQFSYQLEISKIS